MPTRNIQKIFTTDTYYHVYNRGWNLSKIFRDASDYTYFEMLLCRHLSPEPQKDPKGRLFPHYYPDAELVAYCLMGNHFHMLVYQREEESLTKLMRSVSTAYASYFNKKYKQRGALFESTYKAVEILTDSQLQHITRYIHLNHSNYAVWKHSSYGDYLNNPREWIHPEMILELFDSKEQYVEFVSDYEELQRERDAIKRELAAG